MIEARRRNDLLLVLINIYYEKPRSTAPRFTVPLYSSAHLAFLESPVKSMFYHILSVHCCIYIYCTAYHQGRYLEGEDRQAPGAELVLDPHTELHTVSPTQVRITTSLLFDIIQL